MLVEVSDVHIGSIVKELSEKFPSFGGGKVTHNNPISHALQNKSAMFAAGVNIESVVTTILNILENIDSTENELEPELEWERVGTGEYLMGDKSNGIGMYIDSGRIFYNLVVRTHHIYSNWWSIDDVESFESFYREMMAEYKELCEKHHVTPYVVHYDSLGIFEEYLESKGL